MKKYLTIIIECIFLFYIVPLIIKFVPIIRGITPVISLAINSFLLIIFALFYGRHHRFSMLLPLIVFALFIPAGFIFKYTVIKILYHGATFAVVALIGELLGLMFKKKNA